MRLDRSNLLKVIFSIHQTTVSKIVHRVSRIIASLSSTFIQSPLLLNKMKAKLFVKQCSYLTRWTAIKVLPNGTISGSDWIDRPYTHTNRETAETVIENHTFRSTHIWWWTVTFASLTSWLDGMGVRRTPEFLKIPRCIINSNIYLEDLGS